MNIERDGRLVRLVFSGSEVISAKVKLDPNSITVFLSETEAEELFDKVIALQMAEVDEEEWWVG